ncbi:MAG TPA: hypothetical protein V6C81_15645 [Planktothrix sp.]|jgi:hypothetical protein
MDSLQSGTVDLAQKRRLRLEARCNHGASLAEVGPALFLLIFFAFFPAVDLLGIGITYASCVSLNDLQLRQACKLPKSQATDTRGQVLLGIPNSWKNTVVGGFGAAVSEPVTEISYVYGKGAVYVNVSTTMTSHPLFQIPFLPFPGLGQPFCCSITNNRVLENPAYATQ